MNPVSLQSQSPISESHGGDSPVTHQHDPPVLIDGPELPTSVELGAKCRDLRDDRRVTVTGDVLDDILAHIHRAGLVIHTCCRGTASTLGNELDQVTDELDAVIRQLQAGALASQIAVEAAAVRLAIATDTPAEATTSTALAGSALEHWRWAVRGVPFTASSDQARTALRGLAAWYERVSADDAYGNPPPGDGLDALTALEAEPESQHCRRVVVAHWAVRVAEELARCRQRKIADSRADALAHTRSLTSPSRVHLTDWADPPPPRVAA